MRKSGFQRSIRIIPGILAVVVGVIFLWMAVAGPVTVFRVITRGDTTVYDYRRFPGRKLSASPNPFHFGIAQQDGIVPETIRIEDRGDANLEDILESSRTLAFLVIQDDVILYERYLHGHSEAAISQVFSTSKSILSILIGAAIDDGLIGSVADPLTAYVPELSGFGFEKVTIEDLLNMRSNLDYFENDNPFGEHVIFNFTDRLEQEILGLRLLRAPDKQFRYKSGDNALLGLILDRALDHRMITRYTQERIWNPLGMEADGVWGVDHPDGLERTWCCLSLSARDLAKFGRLYLQDGNWEGTQIVSSNWVKTSTTRGAYQAQEWPEDLAHIWNYKYQWWLVSADGDYSTLGKDGQYLYVNPQKNIIIVRLGENTGDLPWFQIFRQIAEGIE